MADHPVVLSFRADGPFWSDLIHLLAYPEGVSYVWPFRYGPKRIHPDLLREADDPARRKKLRGVPAVIGARFQTPNVADRILLIRHVTLVYIDIFAGTYSFQFRLGPAFRFGDASDLHSCTTITKQHVDHLAFREDMRSPLESTDSPELIGVSWRSFARLLSVETALPISDEAKRSLFIHLGAPARKGQETKATRIWKPAAWPWQAASEEVYGYRLKEAQEYQLKYSHYVPALEGANTTVREIVVQPKTAGQSIEFNAAEAMLIGNYGTQQVLVSPIAPTAAWREFALVPKEAALLSQALDIKIITHKVTMPWKVSWSFTRWVWRSFLPMILLFIALVTLGAANLIDRNLTRFLDGTLTWDQVTENWPLIAIVVMGSGLASVAIPLL